MGLRVVKWGGGEIRVTLAWLALSYSRQNELKIVDVFGVIYFCFFAGEG